MNNFEVKHLNGDFEIVNNLEEIEIFSKIRAWGKERKLLEKGDIKTQCIKLQEEVGELSQAILKNKEEELVDAIGDIVIVLTNFAAIKGYNIEYCINQAYQEIKDRQGKMVDGTFIKN